jgi:hypothetical protein
MRPLIVLSPDSSRTRDRAGACLPSPRTEDETTNRRSGVGDGQRILRQQRAACADRSLPAGAPEVEPAVTPAQPDDEGLDLLFRAKAARFVTDVVVLAAREERPYRPTDWADTLVEVEAGQLELVVLNRRSHASCGRRGADNRRAPAACPAKRRRWPDHPRHDRAIAPMTSARVGLNDHARVGWSITCRRATARGRAVRALDRVSSDGPRRRGGGLRLGPGWRSPPLPW